VTDDHQRSVALGAAEPTLGQHANREGQRVDNDIADGISGTPAGYSQPLRRNARYSPRQISTITTSTSG
jgi:hypothetical protein